MQIIPNLDLLGKFIINPKDVIITPISVTKNYGDQDPVFEYNYSQLVNGDTNQIISGRLDRVKNLTQPENVGSYKIDLGDLNFGNNYKLNLSNEEQFLNITKALLKIQPKDYMINQGIASLPKFEVIYDGFKFNELFDLSSELNITTIANTNSIVGSYPITVNGPKALNNYDIEYLSGTLNILPPLSNIPEMIAKALEIFSNSNLLNVMSGSLSITSAPDRIDSIVTQSKGSLVGAESGSNAISSVNPATMNEEQSLAYIKQLIDLLLASSSKQRNDNSSIPTN